MNCNNLLIALSLGLLTVLVLIIVFSKSKFNKITIIEQNYTNDSCINNDRFYPEGKVPGSYLGLTKAEKDNLLRKFVLDNKYKQ